MHILITTDTLSGVWSCTRELVTGLVSRGVRVTLVSFGQIPLPHETSWMDRLHELQYRPTAFRLEWMQEGAQDLAESTAYLTSLVKELKPDLLHLNQMCYGNLPVAIPRVVFAPGDLISWSKSVHGSAPKPSRWLRWYQQVVSAGLSKASVVVAPTVWMLDNIRAAYDCPEYGTVIYNGRNPIFFNPYVSKDESVLAVGRLWDAGKQLSLLTQHSHPIPVCIVDSDTFAEPAGVRIQADVKLSLDQVRVALKGPQTEAQLRLLYSRASIYAATARYEPLGVSALEAAFSRCAIVANDIPPLREMWSDAAVYFDANDAGSLAAAIRKLSEQRNLCQGFGNRAFERAKQCFTAQRMIDDYLRLYRHLLARGISAAA